MRRRDFLRGLLGLPALALLGASELPKIVRRGLPKATWCKLNDGPDYWDRLDRVINPPLVMTATEVGETLEHYKVMSEGLLESMVEATRILDEQNSKRIPRYWGSGAHIV